MITPIKYEVGNVWVERLRRGTIWVVNFAGFLSFLEREKDRLQPTEVDRLFDALAQYQRTTEQRG